MTTEAGQSVCAAIRRGLARPERLSGSEWSQRHRQIADKYAAQKGPWRNDKVPYLAEVMDCLADPAVRKVAVMKAEQVGGTEALSNFVLRAVHQDPGPLMWLWPTEDVARVFCTERFTPTIKACRALAEEFTDRRQDVKTLQLAMGRMTIDFVGSNSPSAIESFPRRYVLIDELDRCPRYIVDAVIGRTTTYTGREKVLLNGRPENEDEGIDAEYKLGDQREFMVPCPRCGVYHARKWSGVKWEGGADADPEVVAVSAWFRCPACDGTIHAHENLWQLRRGVWCPRGQTVTEYELTSQGIGEVAVGRLVGEKERANAFPSFFIRGLLNPFVPNPYGFVAKEFVKNKGAATREWSTRRLGEAYTDNASFKMKAGELYSLCISIEDRCGEGYRLGVAPYIDANRGVLGLTAGCDVQNDRIYVEVVGWGAGGEESWLVDVAALPRQRKDGLVNLWPYLLRKWPVVNLASGQVMRELGIAAAGVDSGTFTREIYEQTRLRQWCRWPREGGGFVHGPQVWATKGHFVQQDAKGATKLFEWSWPETDPPPGMRRFPGKTGAGLLVMGLHMWKTDIGDELVNGLVAMRQRERIAAGLPIKDGELPSRKRWHFPDADSLPEDYFEQLTAEECVTRFDSGHQKKMWRMKKGRDDNHYLDCRVINMAIASARGVRNLGVQAVGAAAVGVQAVAAAAQQQTSVDRDGRGGRGDRGGRDGRGGRGSGGGGGRWWDGMRR